MVVMAGYKWTEIGPIPEEWGIKDISELCVLQRGFDITETTRKPGVIPVYSSSGLSYFHNKPMVNPPGVITGRKGILGKVYFVQEPFWPHDTTLWVRDFKGNDPAFVFRFLSAFRLERFDAATSVPTLNRNNLVGIPIPIPPLEEQRTIAAAMSDIDALINGLDQLIAKKRDLKQAAMQQLLTGKGRLPGYESKSGFKQTEVGLIPKDWNVGTIKDHTSIGTGKRNTQDRIDTGLYPFFVRSQVIERINSFSFEGEAVLTAGDGVGTGKVFHYIHGRFDFHQRVYKISDFSEYLDGFYFFLYFSNHFYDRIMSMTAKSSVDSVRMEMIANMFIPLPTIEEQRLIATVLSDMDAEISALESRRDKTRDLKQGMMQELLTGRIRLNVEAS